MKYDCDLNLDERNSLSILINRIKVNSIILEFGPANGRMTKYMKEKLNCKIYAVEIDQQSAKDAVKYTEKIIVDSIENYAWKEQFKDIKFDYIIFADVLEHLYYPEKALVSIQEFLKEDGSVLVSIPNIAHNSIIINLLKNEFNYNSIGLLDDTHIRFFTKKTFDELINKTGYFISYESATFASPENTEFLNSYEELPLEVSKYLQKLYLGEAYQLIYEIKKYNIEKISDFSEENEKCYTFIQLFIDKGEGNSEKNSIKYPVLQTTELQKFEFDLTGYKNIKNFRLDPFNDSCVIEIIDIRLITKTREIELEKYIDSNACLIKGSRYYFDHNDPQFYFNILTNDDYESTVGLKVLVKYLNIENDSFFECYRLAKEELAIIKNSVSWKITKPFRKMIKFLKIN